MQTNALPRASGSVAKWLRICEQFPEVTALGELRAFSTVYYPVALLRMRLEEYSFEDFNAVEHSLLRFYSCGITDPEELCRWMSLPSVRYVRERLALLGAEGLIETGCLTALGRESLEINQKKKLFDTEQIFQADAITGLLLPREFQVDDRHLLGRQQTQSVIPHLAHSESIALDTIRRAIEGPEKIRDYKRYRKTILNVNVSQVVNVQSKEIRYILALLVWPQCSSVPVVFLPVHGQTESGAYRCDTPLCLPQNLVPRLPGLARGAQILPDAQLAPLADLYALVEADQQKLNLQAVAGWLADNTAFQVQQIALRGDRIEAGLTLARTERLNSLDLEILAALGAGRLTPVEVDMSLQKAKGGATRRRVVLWPYAQSLPPEVAVLAECWAQQGWKLSKAAPLSLRQAVEKLVQSHKEET